MNKIPNILSIFRILLIPFLFFFINNKKIFLTIIIIGGVTDILDGFIARRFNLITKTGAKLDSLADNLFMISAIICLVILFPEKLKENTIIISFVFFFFIINILLKLFILKRIVFAHLYSHKIRNWFGYFLILYIISLGYNKLILLIVAVIYIIGVIEEMLIVIIKKKLDENIKFILE